MRGQAIALQGIRGHPSLPHQVVQVLAPDGVPVFLTDGFKEYITALLTHVGYLRQPERRHEDQDYPPDRG